jgi:hypothetical protein
MMARLTLSWEFPDDKSAVLRFNETIWSLFQSAAEARGIDAEEMISVRVLELIGTISGYRLKE